MSDYPAGVYAHLEFHSTTPEISADRLNAAVNYARARLDGNCGEPLPPTGRTDPDPDAELWREFCLTNGLTAYQPTGEYVPEPFGDEGPIRSVYYCVTAEGALALRERKQAPALKKKPGPKPDPNRDRRIAAEYHAGIEAGEWTGQSDYLRKKHPARWKKSQRNAKTWITTLLKRVKPVR